MRLTNVTDVQLAEMSAFFRRLGSPTLPDLIDELIDRRAEAASELRKLEQSLAFENATLIIEGSCAALPDLGKGWFDGDDLDEYSGDDVSTACRYLDLRGLLQRDPKNSNHIAIRNESEATA